jgi:nicotinamide-nucleotide adenylyltransferase
VLSRKFKRGLFIGRFQPFHLGHAQVVRMLLKDMDEIVIIIGSAQLSHELDNPFTAGERYVMVKEALHEFNVAPDRYHLIPVPDSAMHSVWVAQITSYCPPFDIVCSNDPLTKQLFKELKYSVIDVRFYKRQTLSSTLVRRRMLSGEDWRELVPKSVAADIDRICGVTRLKELAETDSPFGRQGQSKTL